MGWGCHAVINGCFGRTKVQSSIASQFSSRELSITSFKFAAKLVFFLPELKGNLHQGAHFLSSDPAGTGGPVDGVRGSDFITV